MSEPQIQTPLTGTFEVHQIVELLTAMQTRVDIILGAAQKASEDLIKIRQMMGALAAPVPDGYGHQRGCVSGPYGWHTCRPLPLTELEWPQGRDL